MSKVTIGFLVRHYSCYVLLFFVDMEDKFLIGTFGGIERMLIMVYGTRCLLIGPISSASSFFMSTREVMCSFVVGLQQFKLEQFFLLLN